MPCFPARPPQLRSSLRGTERQHVQSLPSNATCGTCLSKRGVSRVLAADTVSTVESRSRLEPHRLRVQPQTRSVGMPCSATSRFLVSPPVQQSLFVDVSGMTTSPRRVLGTHICIKLQTTSTYSLLGISKGYEMVECAPCQLGYFGRSLHVPRFGVFRFCSH